MAKWKKILLTVLCGLVGAYFVYCSLADSIAALRYLFDEYVGLVVALIRNAIIDLFVLSVQILVIVFLWVGPKAKKDAPAPRYQDNFEGFNERE